MNTIAEKIFQSTPSYEKGQEDTMNTIAEKIFQSTPSYEKGLLHLVYHERYFSKCRYW